ncbi:lycopene cyclase family protein [Polynucleobacter brandtiae]|uniref:Lycopene beta-cyclase n=1 Tax=Polynucleobacter brandtiae TaxID=1938816 RepID=A0A2M8VQ42_9BURK|nr:lycopene cyclase family protein [Polynucleobacter brandtiae]PJI79297.1 lycopene beta-cyclase [Polynucleobacter brandtiae]
MAEKYDLIILGGGCAGLSLARELALSKGKKLKVLLLESRKEYKNDRTWCFWEPPEKAKKGKQIQAHAGATHQWSMLRISSNLESIFFPCKNRPYQMLASDQFYQAALKTIYSSPQIEVELGAVVEDAVHHFQDHWEVKTSEGVFQSSFLVDTRPDSVNPNTTSILWQSFYGFEIECSDAIFDSSIADLMDFLPGSDRIAFIYFLPMSATRALVEFTVFAPSPLTATDLASYLESAVKERVGDTAFTILRSESACLPMGLDVPPRVADASYAKVGVMAGSARASTGYAFQRIQQWARLCAASLVQSGELINQPSDPWIVRKMDILFLKVLRSDPAKAPSLFLSLFKNVSPLIVIRFLSGEARALDYLSVMRSLPATPFIRELFRPLLPREKEVHQKVSL